MMGLEPTTFCMASRRSSQLSYIRGSGKYSRGRQRPAPRSRAGRPARCARAARPCSDLPELPRERSQLASESSRSASFFTRYSPRICLTRSSESETTSTSGTDSSTAFSSPAISAAVLGDVVRRDADRLAVRREHGPVLGLEHVAVRGRTGVAARAAVGEERRLHDERVDVERRLLVRMRVAQRGDDLVLPLLGEDRLEPELGDALLRPTPPTGDVPPPPRNVPMPSVYHEHRS